MLAVGPASYTLTDAVGNTPAQLTIATAIASKTLSLAGTGGFNMATLSATGGGNNFDLSGWTFGATLTGAGLAGNPDKLILSKDADFTLSNNSINTSDGLSASLTGITVANLTGLAHPHTFKLDNINGTSHWTGTGTLTSNGGAGTLVASRDADFTLTNTSLSSTDGMSLTLNNTNGNINVANLSAYNNAHTFNLSNAGGTWTGTGSLSNNVGSGTVAATKNADFTLTNSSLAASDGLSMTLAGFGTANLTIQTAAHAFNLDNANGKWTGHGPWSLRASSAP